MIEWFNKRPGMPMAKQIGTSTMSVLGDQRPDWIRLPPELGGERVKVLSAFVDLCPCGDHQAPWFLLDQCLRYCADDDGARLELCTDGAQRVAAVECADRFFWVAHTIGGKNG